MSVGETNIPFAGDLLRSVLNSVNLKVARDLISCVLIVTSLVLISLAVPPAPLVGGRFECVRLREYFTFISVTKSNVKFK